MTDKQILITVWLSFAALMIAGVVLIGIVAYQEGLLLFGFFLFSIGIAGVSVMPHLFDGPFK